MFTRSMLVVSVVALGLLACRRDRDDAAARARNRQPSARERDERLQREQAHAATFSVDDSVRILDTEERVWLRGQTGKILSIERKLTLQHTISEQTTGLETPAPVSRFQIVLDERGVKCWAAPEDVEHRTR